MKNQIITSLVALLPNGINAQNFEQRHIVYFPKSFQLWAVSHLNEIRKGLSLAFLLFGFAFASIGYSQSIDFSNMSFLCPQFIENGKVDTLNFRYVGVYPSLDKIFIADNDISIKITDQHKSGENQSFEFVESGGSHYGTLYFDSEGLTDIWVFTKKGVVSHYSVNYIDAIAEFLNFQP